MEIRVLLVDDEKELIDSMAERLSTRGFTVHAAYDGLSAIDHVEKNPVDAVVLDLQMPGIDGLETLRRIKKHNSEIKVIMLTGHGTLETALEGQKEGAEEYLIKPCDLIHLSQMIKALVEGSL